MLTPLYPIANTPATVTVVAPGALVGAESIPVAPLTIALPSGYTLRFAAGKLAELAAAAAIDDDTLDTAPLTFALVAGNAATVPGSQAYLRLSDTVRRMTEDERVALNVDAELVLDLRAPVYTGSDAEELARAVAMQMNFMIARGDEPLIKRSVAQGATAISTTYRDRFVSPEAAAIVARVTGRQQVRFTPPFAGV